MSTPRMQPGERWSVRLPGYQVAQLVNVQNVADGRVCLLRAMDAAEAWYGVDEVEVIAPMPRREPIERPPSDSGQVRRYLEHALDSGRSKWERK